MRRASAWLVATVGALVLAATACGMGRDSSAASSTGAPRSLASNCPAPVVVDNRCCSDCLPGEAALDWAEQWRRGVGFSCDGPGIDGAGAWVPIDGDPRARTLSLEIFGDGFVVRDGARDRPWRVLRSRSGARGPGNDAFACPWSPDAPSSAGAGCRAVDVVVTTDARSGARTLQSRALEDIVGVRAWRSADRVEYDFVIPSWRPTHPLPPLTVPTN